MMTEPLHASIKYLRLSGLLEHWEDYLKLAAEKRFSHAHLLTHMIEEECRLRREKARVLRVRRAQIPEPLVIETFPFERQPKLNRKKIMELYDTLGYMRHHQNIIWLGATGCGKTGLATSFLIQAINQGYSGRSIRFTDLVRELYRSVADHTEAKVIKRYQSIDCLLIDELGIIEVEPLQVGMFFTLMQNRHKKQPTLLTSNLGFSEWRSFLKNDQLTAALIDRLTENSHIINMKGCGSLRPKLTTEE